MNPESLILAPIITEKGTLANEKAGQVLFRVRAQASKTVDQVYWQFPPGRAG